MQNYSDNSGRFTRPPLVEFSDRFRTTVRRYRAPLKHNLSLSTRNIGARIDQLNTYTTRCTDWGRGINVSSKSYSQTAVQKRSRNKSSTVAQVLSVFFFPPKTPTAFVPSGKTGVGENTKSPFTRKTRRGRRWHYYFPLFFRYLHDYRLPTAVANPQTRRNNTYGTRRRSNVAY